MHNPCMPSFLRFLSDFGAFSAKRKKLSGQMIVELTNIKTLKYITFCGAFHPKPSHCYLARTIYNLHVILQVKPWNSRNVALIYRKRPKKRGIWTLGLFRPWWSKHQEQLSNKNLDNDFRKPVVNQQTFNRKGFFFKAMITTKGEMPIPNIGSLDP